MIYFAQAAESKTVKIGWSKAPRTRIGELQTGHHERLHLIRVIDGPRRWEGWFHRRFAEQRLNGEWFRFVPDMLIADPALVKIERRPRKNRGRSYPWGAASYAERMMPDTVPDARFPL